MLQLRNVSKRFSGTSSNVLSGINLELNEGDFCVILGANGSGKSTLLKAISGEYAIDSGEIYIAGNNVTHGDRSNLIAEVVQDVHKGTIGDMTLLENMVLSSMRTRSPALSFYSRYKEEVWDRVAKASMGLEVYVDMPLASLSGGQRQMVALMMAIYSEPRILLLDEHTSALDPKMQKVVMEHTQTSIAELGLTTMMVTHKMDDALIYGNRLIMLHKGKVVLDLRQDEKRELTIQELLHHFHHYEDLELLHGGAK